MTLSLINNYFRSGKRRKRQRLWWFVRSPILLLLRNADHGRLLGGCNGLPADGRRLPTRCVSGVDPHRAGSCVVADERLGWIGTLLPDLLLFGHILPDVLAVVVTGAFPSAIRTIFSSFRFGIRRRCRRRRRRRCGFILPSGFLLRSDWFLVPFRCFRHIWRVFRKRFCFKHIRESSNSDQIKSIKFNWIYLR